MNKSLIYEGFKDQIGTYNLQECKTIVDAFIASKSSRNDLEFAKKCARNIGRITRDEFEMNMLNLNAIELFDGRMLCSGFKDGINLKDVFKNDQISKDILFASLNEIMKKKQLEVYESVKKEGLDFLKNNRSKKGIKETSSGLQYKVLKKGKGKNPTASSQVKVNYKGTLLSGETFDSSYDRGKPIDFRLNGVIQGWTEGIQLMKPGSKFIFYIPHELGYGANPDPRSGIKPYSLLIFEVELLEILTP